MLVLSSELWELAVDTAELSEAMLAEAMLAVRLEIVLLFEVDPFA